MATMDRRLLKAATSGDAASLKRLASHDPGVLFWTTPPGNTCLHISSIQGHDELCESILAMDQSPALLSAINKDGETPLLAAVARGRASLASALLRRCRERQLSEVILKQDRHGCNALHHAVRRGHGKLALELIEAEPALSRAVLASINATQCSRVLNLFLFCLLICFISAIAKKVMKTRPWLATKENENRHTPVHLAAYDGEINALAALLEHDPSLGYLTSTIGDPLLCVAASQGHGGVARELLEHCPDAPYCDASGSTCLHIAVLCGHTEFVKSILGLQQLGHLINVLNGSGETALHLAVRNCKPDMVAALQLHQDIDVTVLNSAGDPASRVLPDAANHTKPLISNEVSMLMLKADPEAANDTYNLHKQTKDRVTSESRNDRKILTQTYTSNTSLVAILIATITFAAAFTLPGGYSDDAGSEGLPIIARKTAFQAFLISDSLAMFSSLAVAFISIIARWEDFEFLLYYRSFTRKLMWVGYIATTIAFATGLYTVLDPHLLWLAITICFMSVLLPILTRLLGEWPVWKVRIHLGKTFKSELLDMV